MGRSDGYSKQEQTGERGRKNKIKGISIHTAKQPKPKLKIFITEYRTEYITEYRGITEYRTEYRKSS